MNNILIEIILNVVVPALLVMSGFMLMMLTITIILNIQTIIECYKMKGEKKNGSICRHSRK